MGKTSLPLTLVVDPEFAHYPAIENLRAQGHEVSLLAGPVDIVLSRAAFAWGPDMWPYLDQVLKAARKRRRETT